MECFRRAALSPSRARAMQLVMATAIAVSMGACSTDGTGGDEPGFDWPSYGLDHSNSVHNRVESTLSPDNVGELAEAWRAETGGVTGTPAIVDGVAYFADWLGVVSSINADDGSVVWSEKVTEVPISGSVAVTDDVVVAGDLEGLLHALDRHNGDLLWSTQLNPQGASLFASPVVIEGTVVIGMTDIELRVEEPDFRASVVAVDLDDGSEVWRLHTDPGDVPERWVSIWSSVAYDPDLGLVYLGTGNTNGPAGIERADSDLPLADGVLAIEHATGEIAWFFKLIEEDQRRDFDVGGSPNLFTIGGRDVVGVGGKSGDYVVLDRETGELVWKTHLTTGSAGGGVMSTAAIGDGAVYVASNEQAAFGTIFALEMETGSILWQRELDEPIFGGSMALANGVLYRGTFHGTAVALDAGDGSVLWTESLNAPLAGGFSVSAGTLYVGYGSGTPNSLRASEGGVIAYRLP